ncbi:hypothetical protein [Clostridium tunisiense]|uniref:hypothetical protein n=1 Tax=Clostridium tunisiense TaxID=219748 RepID=UPI0002F4B587|nr:hypothetical protein [Clostridium tunisiense]
MLQIEKELIRLQLLLELYEYQFCICNYKDIEKQEYILPKDGRCEVVSALYYLSDKGFINVKATDKEDVLIIFIRSRGIDEVELKIRKATTVALAYSYNRLLTPNFDDVPDDLISKNIKYKDSYTDNSEDKNKKNKDKDDKDKK